ncbi:TPA: Lar family restriction alleviation protein [Proteus mirabilis]
MNELKKCPFCGGKAKSEKYLIVYWRVRCTKCFTLQTEMVASEKSAIAAWNRRATKRLNFNLAIDLCKEILAGETALKIKEKYGISERTYKGIKRGKYWTDAMSKAKKMEQES